MHYCIRSIFTHAFLTFVFCSFIQLLLNLNFLFDVVLYSSDKANLPDSQQLRFFDCFVDSLSNNSNIWVWDQINPHKRSSILNVSESHEPFMEKITSYVKFNSLTRQTPHIFYHSLDVLKAIGDDFFITGKLKHLNMPHTMWNSSSTDGINELLGKVYASRYAPKINSGRLRIATFKNVRANNWGLIHHDDSCTVVRNGGCIFMNHDKIYELTGPPLIVGKPVVYLCAGASGSFHFPMEVLVGLAAIDYDTLRDSHLFIPVIKPYTISWLNALNIPTRNLLNATHIYAEKLIVPEMGQCGKPTEEQLVWLSEKALQKSVISRSRNRPTARRQTIVILERTKSRGIGNFEAIKRKIVQFANQNDYDIILQSDEYRFPAVEKQIQIFSQASIVVSSHGAGQLFINFMTKNSCVLDFSHEKDPWGIYARIAYLRAVSYLLFVNNSRNISTSDLEYGLEACHYVASRIRKKEKMYDDSGSTGGNHSGVSVKTNRQTAIFKTLKSKKRRKQASRYSSP